MKLIARALVLFTGNIAGLMLARELVPGFLLAATNHGVLTTALVLGLLNLTLKPFLKLILSPLIILTLGFVLILINAVVLGVLDIFTDNLTILGILPLLFSSLIIGLVNFIFHLGTKP